MLLLSRVFSRACAGACLALAGLSLLGCDTAAGTSVRPAGTGAGTVLTWTSGTSPANQDSGTQLELNSVAFGGKGIFVAVGEAGTLLTSPDGVTWTSRTSPATGNLYGVVYAEGQFIVVGEDILTGTPDGVTWTREDASDDLSVPLTAVTYAKGTFVAVGTSQVMTSTDGSTWNALPTEPDGLTGPTVALYDTAFGDGLFVTVGTYNTSTSSEEIVYDGLIATSPDGASWDVLPYTSNYLSGITYGGGQFVAVGREGSILTSTDGTSWAPRSARELDAGATPYLISVLYGGGQYVVTGNYVGVNPSTGFLLTSPDAKTWSVQPVAANVYGVAYGEVDGTGTWVVVGGQ
jgi:hypothetical protein